MALKEFRTEQKKGRQDRGNGDETFGTMVEGVRDQKGWTQEEWARRAGVHATTIGKIESGQRGMSLLTFCKLSQALHDADEWDWTAAAIRYLAHQR